MARALLDWREREGREGLPWQHHQTLYRTWVSEIMLQQTQVAVVIPYFERFVARFPAIADLAAAPLDEVLRLWSGLGYYARARHLHEAARRIMQNHQGAFPDDLDQVMALPGIGRSTAGAILSLALGQRQPILDGNVKRVLARCFAVAGWPGQRSVAERLWALAEYYTPTHRVAEYNQAIMDLGATLCTRHAPACGRCPVTDWCQAFSTGRQTDYPSPKPRRARPVQETRMLAITSPTGEILLQRRPPVGLWGGLWTLPECRLGDDPRGWCQDQLGAAPRQVIDLGRRHQDFSHFRLAIAPLWLRLAVVPSVVAEEGGRAWHDPRHPPPVGLAAPIARILAEVAEMQQKETALVDRPVS